MNVKAFALAAAGCLALASAASADLVGAKAVNLGDIGAGVNSFAIYLIFDNALDQLLTVNGDVDISPLIFDSTTPLVQNNLFEGMHTLDDVPTAADLGGDSWVVIGNPDTHNTAFSPGFLGQEGQESVILGTHFEQLHNGGYFDANPRTRELPDEDMQIQIAQFSLDIDDGNNSATYQATAFFHLGGGKAISRAFALSIPAPGALALLGLAGVAGGRRGRS